MQDITRLLRSAGLAVKALTNHGSSDIEGKSTSIEQQQSSFTAATSQYFSLLSSIDVRLRRQVYALEEAEIIPADVASKESQGSSNIPAALAALGALSSNLTSSQSSREKAITGGNGLGKLDVGWLNSQNDKVGKEMEAELWAQARELVEAFEKEQQKGSAEEIVDVDMTEATIEHSFLDTADQSGP